MRATLIYGPGDIRSEIVDDPKVQKPGDAIVRVVASCVCGSDLWPYRGITKTKEPRRIGHEFIGVVEDTGNAVTRVKAGDFVIAPFSANDGTCVNCLNGFPTSCDSVANWGAKDDDGILIDGGQGEFVRVPMANGTLVPLPAQPAADVIPSVLTLSDVMCTGHHAAVAARVGKGSNVTIVGDGAVGLCGVIAAKRLGAERIVIMSRHAPRQELAKKFGATDIVETRGDEGVAEIQDLLKGPGADSVLECVGTKQSMQQAIRATRPGGHVGYVGVPNGGPELPIRELFNDNINIGGGMAPARAYIEGLLPDVMSKSIDPGAVFDLELSLEDVAQAYKAMDERTAIKVLLKP